MHIQAICGSISYLAAYGIKFQDEPAVFEY